MISGQERQFPQSIASNARTTIAALENFRTKL
jgi:hypothetical protein